MEKPDKRSLTLLNAEELAKRCRRFHFLPSDSLAPHVAVIWGLSFDSDCAPLLQKVLPDPCVQIIVEANKVELLGVVTKAFSATLRGNDFVIGLKFRPAGFYSFIQQPLWQWTNKRVPLTELFPQAGDLGLPTLAKQRQAVQIATTLQRFLEAVPHHAHDEAVLAANIVDSLAAQREITSVEAASRAFALSERTLQRLCRTYIGVTPKWLIRRFRLKEAAAYIESGDSHPWSEFAIQLGYFDQSHFIRDFKAMVGCSPKSYLQSLDTARRC